MTPHFHYVDGVLMCEQIPAADLAMRYGTPLYVYSAEALTENYHRFAAAFSALKPTICFSVKSCPNTHILRLLVEAGAGLDVVSGGELYRAICAGCDPAKIVYAGVGKTSEEIVEALGGRDWPFEREPRAPVGAFNIESEQEFQVLAGLAASMQRTTIAALRVNPDVDAGTHKYTTTGTAENKFGVDLRRAAEFISHHSRHPFVRLSGLHIHLGSPIPTTGPYVKGLTRVLKLIDDLASRGITIDTLDIGGGFPVDYHHEGTQNLPPIEEYAAAIVALLAPRVAAGLKVILEPGRWIAAPAGLLLTRVQYIKAGAVKKFVICDAGMHTLLRPALYEAWHMVWPARIAPAHEPHPSAPMDGLEPCDIVGPICESSDFLAKDRPLPPVARGDLLAVFTTGAYGMSMASTYNSHPLPAEVLVTTGQSREIRVRSGYADLLRGENT